MLNALVPHVLAIRERWPRFFDFVVGLGRRFLARRLGIYPRPMANEVRAAARLIRSTRWNMTYGRDLEHHRLEAEFAEYLGGGYAVAVNTGGMALQMAVRALGLRPGDEVIQQIDTCSATAMAVTNAGCTPLFADVSPKTFLLAMDDVQRRIGPATKAIMATHLWGNVEDLAECLRLKERSGLLLIEDACLALGARYDGRPVGSFGDVSVFSFGSLKPIQAGEGGMIFTRDEMLARELRAMRHWGDRTIEFGVRDTLQLSWNGRMSEILAAVLREQLRGYPGHLARLRESVAEFARFLSGIDGLSLVYGATTDANDPAFTQVVVRLDEAGFGWSKTALLKELYARGVQVRHASFELTNSLAFYKNGTWADWILRGDQARVRSNYTDDYPDAQIIYDSTGLGLGNVNFLSTGNLRHLMQQIAEVARSRP